MCRDSKQNQQISALEFNFPAATLSHPVPLKEELVLFYIAEKDSSGGTLISPPCHKTSVNVKMSESFI